MSTPSVLLAGDRTRTPGSRYTLFLTNDSADIEDAQRLRYEVFTAEPGFVLAEVTDDRASGRDADRYDEHCDHLLVRDNETGELVGCYRMLSPPAAIAAGGLYAETEFDVTELAPLRPSMVEMGRAAVREDHRNGGVVLLMWTGILAYLDRWGYDYAVGCVSVALQHSPHATAGEEVRGVRDFVRRRHVGPYRVRPYRPVVVDGRVLDDIPAPARVTVPPLMRGYLRLGARVCGEPAHDPDFGVADFPVLLDKRQADVRYLERLRSAAAAMDIPGGVSR